MPHDWLNTIANFWNSLTVTESDTVGLKRQSDGRFTEILIGTSGNNDTEGFNTDLNPDGRMTIEQNPEDYSGDADSHAKERQLRNVHLTKDGSSSVPFFVSATPYQGAVPDKVTGELYWATLDANRAADDAELVYRSLAAADTHEKTSKGKYSLSLYGFTGCAAHQVPYSQAVTNPAGSGRELIWRYPVAIGGDPIGGEIGTTITFVTGLTATTPPESGSYAAVSFSSRTGTVHRGAINYAAPAPDDTAYLSLTFDYSEITPSISHNLLSGTATFASPDWTATNNGHDGRYLRIDKNWATGEDYHNTCTGIAHLTTGERAIDFANGLLFGDTPAEGATIDYGARKLYAFDGSQVETVDWQTRTLTAASAAAPWTATLAFRIASSDPAKYVDFVVGDGTLEIKDQTGERLAFFQRG